MPEGGSLPADGLYIVTEGEVELRRNDEELAKIGSGAFFFEEHLALDDLDSDLDAVATPHTKLLKLSQEQWRLLPEQSQEEVKQLLFVGDLVNVHMHDFQQPINCCNITAIAFALTALGYPTHVDDLFLNCKLPSAYVVNDGMTLGEVFNVACIYLHQKGLKNNVNVQCYYFDEHIVSPQTLINALHESEHEGGNNDILVANFGVGLARNIPNNNGGHFALIAKFNPQSGLIHMVDVHPKKYGKLWTTTTDRLYRAMAQRDSSSHRSRGLLRLTKNRALCSALDGLERHVIQADLSDYLEVDDNNVASFFRDPTTNLNSISTLAIALRQLGIQQADTDHIMHTLRISYTELLSKVPTHEALCQIISRYLQAMNIQDLQCQPYRYCKDRLESENQLQFFQRQLASINIKRKSLMILNIDINKLMAGPAVELPNAQFSETAVLKQFWCACIDFDAASQMTTITDSTVSTSLVWHCKTERIFEALDNMEDPAMILMGRT